MQSLRWRRVDGASHAAIDALKSLAPDDLPDSYSALLTLSNGGEGPLAVQPFWLQLYPAEEAARIERDGNFREHFRGMFVIGGECHGEAVAFDLRKGAPYPVVAFDMTNVHLEESLRTIAPSFEIAMDLVGSSAR